MNLLDVLGLRRAGSGLAAQETRVQRYARMARLFEGFLVRENQSAQTQVKRLAYNWFRPVSTVSATFLAGKPLAFEIEGGSDADNQTLSDVWQRSGSDASFLKAAHQGSIYGDACIKVEESNRGPVLRWMDPSVCYPEFDPHDHSRLIGMVVAYRTEETTGGFVDYRADYRDGVITVEVTNRETKRSSYDENAIGGPPFVWIPNDPVVGSPFGRSDLEPIVDLVERFEHVAIRHFNVLDYYGTQNIAIFGARKGATDLDKSLNTTYWFESPDARMELVGLSGDMPAYSDELERLRDAISEVSEVPRVAFGKAEGSTNLSGVALKILYGPILVKTDRKRAVWGPGIERAMWTALSLTGSKVEPEAVHAVWQDPMPGDELAQMEALEAKVRLGVSREQILRELEYSPAEIEKMLAESDQAAERSAARQAAMFDSGGQVRE